MPEIRKNEPLWTAINPVPTQYPWLSEDVECEVCIIGGGITGVMTAYRFAQEGKNTVLVTANPIGFSSTAAASPWICYDGGEKFTDLAKKLNCRGAGLAFKRNIEALDNLEQVINEIGEDVGFNRRDSIIYTDFEGNIPALEQEYNLRKQHGFDVEFLNKDIAETVFPFKVEGAIISKNLAAEVDPYRLTHAIAKKANEMGVRIYENTKISQINNSHTGSMLETDTRRKINAETLIMAIGNECTDFVDNASSTRTAFATVTKAGSDFSGWAGKCIISTWEKPNITLSSTPDGRIFTSGLDTAVIDKDGKMYGIINFSKIPRKKYDELESAAMTMFPDAMIPPAEYAFAGSYIETPDNLPIIGEQEGYENCYFAVCPGGNSALYAEIAGRMLLSKYKNENLRKYEIFDSRRFA